MAFLTLLCHDAPDRMGSFLDFPVAVFTKLIAFFLHEIVVGRCMDAMAEETGAVGHRLVDVRARKLALSVAGETEIRHLLDEKARKAPLVRKMARGAHPHLERAVL